MKSKKSQSFLSSIFSLLLILLIIITIASTSYYLYLNIPRNPEKLDIEIEPIKNQDQIISEASQFYSNMKFNHNQISYNIDSSCEDEKNQKMLKAFEELSKEVPIITFFQTFSNPDIEITCSQENKPGINERHFVAGEGGAKEIIQTGRYNVINEGTILLYDNNKLKATDCDYPNVELHELLHVFGFDHVDDKKSIMYPFIESCDQVLDKSITDLLKKLYSQENLPDLYFENLSVIKKGRFIDFNLTIKNSGSINAEDVTLEILDNERVIEKRNFEEIKFGSGISLQTKNLRLKRLNPDEISFFIDKNNDIKEIDETNNIIVTSLN